MLKLYTVAFEVDNGVSYENDTALIIANDAREAEVNLREHINSIDSETCVSKIYNVRAFEGEVFTGRHGCR